MTEEIVKVSFSIPLQPGGCLFIIVERTRYYLRLAHPQNGVWKSLTRKEPVTERDLNRLLTHNSRQEHGDIFLSPQGPTLHVSLTHGPPLFAKQTDVVRAIDKAILHVKDIVKQQEQVEIKQSFSK